MVSGFAALAAVWLAVVTARAGRRVPLTDAYMGAWQSILDVLAVATERRSEPPPEEHADRLMRQFNAADHRLSVIEATLRVRLYGRDIRHDLKNLLLDVLYDNPDIRQTDGFPDSVTWNGWSDGTRTCAVVFTGTVTFMVKPFAVCCQEFDSCPYTVLSVPSAEASPPPRCGSVRPQS